MKGISLPLETVVLLILAAIVLAALLGFFLGVFTPGKSEADLVRRQLEMCQQIASKDRTCNPANPEVAELIGTMRSENVCRPDRAACRFDQKDGDKSCINNCCQAFCPRIQ